RPKRRRERGSVAVEHLEPRRRLRVGDLRIADLDERRECPYRLRPRRESRPVEQRLSRPPRERARPVWIAPASPHPPPTPPLRPLRRLPPQTTRRSRPRPPRAPARRR